MWVEWLQNRTVMADRRRGTCVAGFQHVRAVALGVGSAMLMMGCLVTDKIEVEQEQNLPPSSVFRSNDPDRPSPARIHTFDITGTSARDGGVGAAELTFEVEVRDPNLEQGLVAQILTDTGTANIDRIGSTGALTRAFQFRLNAADLSPDGDPSRAIGCHRVELWVSSSFLGNRVPADENDVAAMFWWIRAVGATPGEIDLSSCPR